MNRRNYIYISIIMLIILISYGIFSYGTPINEEIPAVKFRLGEEEIIEHITLKINGTYKKRLFSDDVFTGKIYIEGYEFTNESSGFSNLVSTLTDVHIDGNGYGMYKYIKLDSERKLQNLLQGEIFVKDKFSMITMTITEEKSLENPQGGWILVSGPAKTRIEALAIAKLLMKEYASLLNN